MKKKYIILTAIAILVFLIVYIIVSAVTSSHKNGDNYGNNNNNIPNSQDPIQVMNLTLNVDNIELGTGEYATLIAKIDPINASDKTLIWKSSNDNIVTVDSNGKIKGVAVGSATITVTSKSNNITDECIVLVNNSSIPVDGLVLSTNLLTLTAGDRYQIQATISPSNATNTALSYTTTNSQIATISNTGEITALKAGNVEIIVTAENNITATLNLTVVAKVSGISPFCSNSLYYLNTSKTSCVQYLYYSSCPSGYSYDSNTKTCKTNRTPSCAYPAVSLPNGECSLKLTSAPKCTTGTYDSTLKKCVTKPTCTVGVYSPIDNKCINGISSCTSGSVYDPTTRKCNYDQPAPCPSSTYIEYHLINSNTCRSTTNPVCTIGTFNPNNGICETGGSSSLSCPSGTYNSTAKTCSSNFTCSSGYTANVVTGSCQRTTISSACPSGYIYNSSIGKCVKTVNTSCSSASHTINSSGYCTGTNTLNPSCPDGYTYQNGVCLEN